VLQKLVEDRKLLEENVCPVYVIDVMDKIILAMRSVNQKPVVPS